MYNQQHPFDKPSGYHPSHLDDIIYYVHSSKDEIHPSTNIWNNFIHGWGRRRRELFINARLKSSIRHPHDPLGVDAYWYSPSPKRSLMSHRNPPLRSPLPALMLGSACTLWLLELLHGWSRSLGSILWRIVPVSVPFFAPLSW